MNKQSTKRRQLLKYGGLLGLGMISNPQAIWSNAAYYAQKSGNDFIFQNKFISEFSPPSLPRLDTLKARLHWNENPYGPSPKAIKAFNESSKNGNYYSWDIHGDFINKLALKEGVDAENIMTGPGSSDLLEKVGLVLFNRGGNVVSADPCYMSLINVISSIGGEWKSLKLTPNFEHDLDAMISAIDSNTKLVYITNPNNPTATSTNKDKLYEFCDLASKKVPVFVDEAYIEISEGGLQNSMVELISKGRDVIVTRTFSKIHGMAGMRLGYMVASKERIAQISAITRGGMGISGPTLNAAMASLDDSIFLNDCKEKLISNREFTVKMLKLRNFHPLPSSTNFIIFKLGDLIEPNKFLRKMYDYKVSVKVMRFWGSNWCRVSIGKLGSMKIFIDALDNAVT